MKKFFLFCLVFGILIAGVSLASSGGGESSQITVGCPVGACSRNRCRGPGGMARQVPEPEGRRAG